MGLIWQFHLTHIRAAVEFPFGAGAEPGLVPMVIEQFGQIDQCADIGLVGYNAEIRCLCSMVQVELSTM